MNVVLRFLRWPYFLIALLFGAMLVLGSSETARASHLTCGTTYYYRARSTDASSNTTTSSEKSFTTSACPAGESGSGGSSGSGGTGGTTTTGTTTSTAAPTTTTTTTTTGGTTTAKKTTTTTTTTKKITTPTAAKTTATSKPGEPTTSPEETATQVEDTPTAPVTQAIAIPQSIGDYRIFYAAVSRLDFCSGTQTSGCIDPDVLPPPPPPPAASPPCQDGSFDLQAEHLRGPEFLANIIERAVPEIPCAGPAEGQADQADDSDTQYCAGYQESSLITKLLVANPCVELDEIGQDRLDCYADLAVGTPCIFGEGTDSTFSPDGTGDDITLDEGGGTLICPPPSVPVGDACVAQDPDIPVEDLGDEEIGPDDDGEDGDDDKFTCSDGRVVRFEADCGEGPPPPPDYCHFLPTDSRPLPPLSIVAPEHRHQGDPELHIKAGETVAVGAESSSFNAYSSYFRVVEDHPELTLYYLPAGGNASSHTSIVQDSPLDLVQPITNPVRVTYTGVTENFQSSGFCNRNQSGYESISIIVEPNLDLVGSLVVTPSDIAAGGVSSLQWLVNDGQVNVREIQLDNGTGFKTVNSYGQELVQPQQTTTYTLRIITNPNSQVIDRQATVTVHGGQTRCGDGTTWVAANTFPAGCPQGPPGDCNPGQGPATVMTSLITPQHAHPSDPTVRVTAGEPLVIGSDFSGPENPIRDFEGYIRTSVSQPNLYKVFRFSNTPDNGSHRLVITDDGADFLSPGTKVTQPTLVRYDVLGSNTCPSVNWLPSITVLVLPPGANEPSASLTATPDVIMTGGTSTLEWATTNATTVTLNGDPVAASGTQVVSPSTTTDYTLVATGPGGELTRTVTVTVTESVGACIIRNPAFILGEIRANPAERGPYDSPLTVILSAASTVEDPGRLAWWFTTDDQDPALRAQERRSSPDARGREITLTLLAPGARVRAHLIVADPCNLEQSRSFDQQYFLPLPPAPPPDPLEPTVELKANGVIDHLVVGVGDTAELTWTSTNTTTCLAQDNGNGWSGTKPASGNEQTTRHFAGTRTYAIRCDGQGGSAEDLVRISVRIVPPGLPTVTLSGTPTEVEAGRFFTLSSTATQAERVVLNIVEGLGRCSGPNGLQLPQESLFQLLFPHNDVERCGYSVTATGLGGSATSEVVTITKIAGPPPPTITLTGAPAEVAAGGSFTLSWTSTEATRITLSVVLLNVGCNGHGLSLDPVAVGSVTLPFPSSGTDRCSYLAVAEGAGGSTRSQTVTIGTAAPPPPAEGVPPGQAPPAELILRFSPDGGANLAEPVSVTLDAQVPPEERGEFVIFYTSDPTVSDRNLEQGTGVERYTAPITLSATTELRAIAFLGSERSEIARALFRFRHEECTPAVICRLQGNFKLQITPDPEGTVFDGPTVFELKPIPPSHAIASLHLERGSSVPTRSSAQVATTVTISERGVYTFKAFGSESDPLTVFIDIAAPPADPGAPTVAITPSPGTFNGPVTVGLAASGGSAPVVISYNTNGADPRTNGTTYQGPLTLTQSTFLKYVAKDSTGKMSAVGQAFYAIESAPAIGSASTPAGPGSTLLTWQPVAAAATSAAPPAAVSYEVSCNGKLVGTVDQPIVSAPAPKEPCTYTVAVKSGDQVVESIAQVTPVALAAALAAPAAKAKAVPATPVAKAVAAVETTVAPAVATTATVAAVVAATGAASAPVAAAASGLLYQILAHGFGVVALLTWRRKGPFAEVLDRTTGLPVGGATVTLLEATSSRATAVATTDTLGRFSMLVDQPGRYLVRVSHPRYATWHSTEVTIGKPQEVLNLPTITLQTGQVATSLSRAEAYSQLILSGLNAARLPLLIAGTLILLATSVEASGTLRLTPDRSASIALYVALWASEAWVRTKPRPYGVVVDGVTGQPVTRAIVRLLNGATGRLMRTVVTGSQGRFQFLAPKGSGSLVVVHPGYEPYRQDHLMLTGKDSFVNETVRLRPLTEGASPINPPASPPLDSAQGKPPPPPVRPIVPPQLPRYGPPPP